MYILHAEYIYTSRVHIKNTVKSCICNISCSVSALTLTYSKTQGVCSWFQEARVDAVRGVGPVGVEVSPRSIQYLITNLYAVEKHCVVLTCRYEQCSPENCHTRCYFKVLPHLEASSDVGGSWGTTDPGAFPIAFMQQPCDERIR